MICLSLTGATRDEWSAAIDSQREWIDIVELRIDLLKPAERGVDDLVAWWNSHREAGAPPAILTIRRSGDLGRWEGDEAQRLHLFNRLVTALRPDYIDIELDRVGIPDWDRLAATVAHDGGRVIRSHHEARSTPSELATLMARLAAEPQEIPKLAVTPQSTDDTVRFVNAAREFGRMMRGRGGIWIAMGEYGLPTRVWPARCNSVITYAADLTGGAAAPGQVAPEALARTFRVGAATAEWPAFAVVGDPIAHSRSPAYHNGFFVDHGIDAIYLPIRIDSFDSFEAVVEAFALRGASVTVPHKRAAREYVEARGGTLSEEVIAGGVANTVYRAGDGWHAANTDIAALYEAIAEAYPRNLSEARFLVVGAGGAARGALAAFTGRVASIEIANRTISRAEEAARDFGLDRDRVFPLSRLSELEPGRYDVIVQTTSVGMAHGPAGDPTE